MKNLTKIFMAVVALFAVSCVADATKDLAPELGLEGVKGETTLALSLEESRTHLGEKVDGLYQLNWSEGDRIAVNGVPSHPLTAELAGTPNAVFTFDEPGVIRPYYIVYPASEVMPIEEGEGEGEGEGEPAEPVVPETPANLCPVTFLGVQTWEDGTFCQGAAPMYAHAAAPAEGEVAAPIQLQHLAGVLRIAPKGTVVLKSLTVTSESGAIAGPFMVDCLTGKLTAQEGATRTVTVDFGGGLSLDPVEATPIYVAVPSGNYGTFLITLHTDEDKMTVKFNSDVKPIAAGVVREFGEFEYQANTLDSEDADFLIDSEEALVEFARIASTFYPRASAKVVADINMANLTEEQLKLFPIKNFGAYTFDGGSAEGYTISNLTTPLFETTAANIKNLKLTDINVVETERVVWGAIAVSMYQGSLTNCEASGTIEINNTTFDGASATTRDVINIGGLVGQAGGVTFENCVNRVNITIKSCAQLPESGTVYCEVGGVAGIAHSGASFNNADNYGSITADGEMNVYLELSGIVGRIAEYSGVTNHVHTFTGCDNNGVISTTENFKSTKQLNVAGITSQLCSYIEDFSNNHNHANIYHAGTSSTLYIAGICSVNIWSPIENCTNNAHIYSDGATGNIHLSGLVAGNPCDAITNCHNNAGGKLYLTANATADAVYVGGISGGTETNKNKKGKITSCNNYATIECAATAGADNVDDVYLAGIVSGSIQAEVTGCRNEGAITFTGKVGLDSDDASHLQIGGITAMKTTDGSNGNISDCHNTADLTFNGLARKILVGGITGDGSYTTISNCTNSGKIEQMAECAVTTNMAGIVADSSWGSIIDCTNSGKVVVSGTSGNTYLGGIATYGLYRDAKIENCTNSGDIYISKTGYVSRGWLAGILGHDLSGANANDATKLATITGCTNSGAIKNEGSAANTRLGGIVGTVTMGHVIDCTNTGAITNSGTSRDNIYMGGIVGGAGVFEGSLSGCKNTGDITHNGEAASGKNVSAGGLVTYRLFVPMTNCHNEGNITIGGTSTGRLYIAGLVSNQQDESSEYYTSADAVLNNCTNKGSITIGTEAAAKTTSSFHVSGLINYSRGRIHNCQNKAEGDILVQNMTISGTLVTGGLACYTYLTGQDTATNKWENNYNYGDITFKDITANTAPNIGGLATYATYANTSTLNKTITVDDNGKKNITYPLKEETVVNTNRTSWYNCANHGKITVDNIATKVSSNKHARTIIGGCFGTASNIFDYENVDNNGEVSVKIKATSNVFVAGHTGYWGSTAVKNYTAYHKNCDNTVAITLESVKDASYAGTSSTEGHLVGGILAQTYMNNAGNGQYHVWENVSNSGTVTLKGNTFNDGSHHMAGGVSAYHYTYTNFNNCYNTGTVKVEPTANTTIKNLYVGGLAAELRSKNSNTTENPTTFIGCVNTGAVEIKSLKTTAICYAGGLVGYLYNGASCVFTFDGCANSGNVSLNEVTATGNSYIGGFLGYGQPTTTKCLNTNTNIGNVTVSGGSFTATKTYIGGIVGHTAAPIAGAKCYCDIQAPDGANRGWIMGTARASATLATNCWLAASPQMIWNDDRKKYDEEDPVFGDSTFMDYIYGGTTTWPENSTYDGCQYLAEEDKPTVTIPTAAN